MKIYISLPISGKDIQALLECDAAMFLQCGLRKVAGTGY